MKFLEIKYYMFFFLILHILNIANSKKSSNGIPGEEINIGVTVRAVNSNITNTANSLKTTSDTKSDKTYQIKDPKPESKTFQYLSAFDKKKIKHDSDKLNSRFRKKTKKI